MANTPADFFVIVCMKIKRSTWIPAVLFAYLCLMAWIGRGELLAGHYAYYFGLVVLTCACIVALHFHLRRREKRR